MAETEGSNDIRKIICGSKIWQSGDCFLEEDSDYG